MSRPTWMGAILEWERLQFGRAACGSAEEVLLRAGSDPASRALASEQSLRQIAGLNDLFYRRLGVAFRPRSPDLDFALTPTLRDRAGNCLGLTTVYVALGEILDLPIRPLLFEGHVTAAHVAPSGRLDLELSRGGLVVSPRAARRMRAGRGEGRLLTDEEFLAVHLSNRAAFVLAPAGQFPIALDLVETALKFFPGYTSAQVNRAVLLYGLDRTSEARDALRRVLDGRPDRHALRAILDLASRIDPGVAVRIDRLLGDQSDDVVGGPDHDARRERQRILG